MPPLDYITSARCLVFRHDSVLVQRDRDSTHILPGGRREADESPLEAVHREVLEETGWSITDPVLIGFVHFAHLTPKPSGHAYPYPDFVQVVYLADARESVPDARLDDGYEVESVFRPVADVQGRTIPATQRLFLDAALRMRPSLPEWCGEAAAPDDRAWRPGGDHGKRPDSLA
jgi:8-oxo-dGTP pyrophosphatase MutT (NUDIX family)